MDITDEQKLARALLSGDYVGICAFSEPAIIARAVGEVAQKTGEHQRIIEESLSMVLDRNFEPLVVCRIIKTWLTDFRLSFDPERSIVFDRFHQLHGAFIVDRNSKFDSY